MILKNYFFQVLLKPGWLNNIAYKARVYKKVTTKNLIRELNNNFKGKKGLDFLNLKTYI
jgi:hypothetical protein